MPCNTVVRSTVALKMTVENKPLLIAALKTLNYRVVEQGETLRFYHLQKDLNGTLVGDQLQMAGERRTLQQFNLNELKKAYSVQVVQEAASEFGWDLEQDEENQFAFTYTKQGF